MSTLVATAAPAAPMPSRRTMATLAEQKRAAFLRQNRIAMHATPMTADRAAEYDRQEAADRARHLEIIESSRILTAIAHVGIAARRAAEQIEKEHHV